MSILNAFYKALSNNTSLDNLVTEDIKLHVSHPINDVIGLNNVKNNYWQLLSNSLRNIERKPFIEFQSEYEGQEWIAATGYFVGKFENSLLGIPATGKTLYLRFTELVQLQQGKIADYYIILDFLDVMNQAGVTLYEKAWDTMA